MSPVIARLVKGTMLLELSLQLSANQNISGIFQWNKPADNKNMEPDEKKQKGGRFPALTFSGMDILFQLSACS